MADIAPELYAKIKESFDQKYAQAQLFGGPLSETLAKINNGTATFRDADLYAVEVGSMMADAMKEHLILEDLPGKTLYRNIAQRTIGEGLKDTYGIVSNVTRTIQEEINAENKIGLKAVQPKLETDRVDKIVNRAVNAKSQKTLDNNLTDTVPTFARQVVDDTQKANARLHNKAGLNVKVEREYDDVGLHNGTDVCDWCLQRAGTWTYEKALDNGVFERHEGCGCIITYTSAKGEVTRSESKYSGWKSIVRPGEKEQEVIRIRNSISSRNVAKGKARAVAMFDVDLNSRQQRLLDQLPRYDSYIVLPKSDVSMADLASMTAKTGDEFAMFTRGSERLIIRGNSNSVNVTIDKAKELKENGYKWSGHTHPGYDELCLFASGDDYEILKVFGQKQSVTYNSLGQFLTYEI